jgi:hypothetical protein
MATPGALNAFAATGEDPINYIVRHMNLDPGRWELTTSCRTCAPCARARACSRPTTCETALASGSFRGRPVDNNDPVAGGILTTGEIPRLRLGTIATASGLQISWLRHRAMAKESDSTSTHGYGGRDWDGDGRVHRKDDDFPTPSAAHMSRRRRAGIIQRPAVRLAHVGRFA